MLKVGYRLRSPSSSRQSILDLRRARRPVRRPVARRVARSVGGGSRGWFPLPQQQSADRPSHWRLLIFTFIAKISYQWGGEKEIRDDWGAGGAGARGCWGAGGGRSALLYTYNNITRDLIWSITAVHNKTNFVLDLRKDRTGISHEDSWVEPVEPAVMRSGHREGP